MLHSFGRKEADCMTIFDETSLPIIRELADSMPGGFFIYQAGGDERLVYANLALARIFGCDSVDELMTLVHGSFRGIVYPEDYERIEQSIDGQIAQDADHYDYVQYRIVRRDGAVRWLIDYGHLIHTEDRGDYFCVFVNDATEEHERQLAVSRQNEIAKEYLDAMRALGSTYDYVYKVDRHSRAVRILHGDSDRVGITRELTGPNAYELSVSAYVARNVYFDDRAMMLQVLDFVSIVRQLSRRASFTQSYRVFRDGELHHYAMKAVRDGEADSYRSIILSFVCEDAEAEAAEARRQPPEGNGKRKVLVIEDNEMNRELLSDILEDDYEVLEAENGAAGLECLQAHCRELSVVLLDLQMPVMNGLEFLQAVSHDPLLSSVPVIVMTADTHEDTEEECTKLGAVEFLEKPYRPGVMLSRIRNMIRIRETAAEMDAIEYDDLTGLYTRQAFYHYAAQHLKQEPDTDFSLLMIDIDDFKLINSVYGETAGDRLLKHIADNLRQQSKQLFAINGRYGADRFAILYRAEAVPEASVLEEKLRTIAAASTIENLVVRVGLYEHVSHELEVSRICDRALEALNTVKHSYEHRVGTWDGPLATRKRQEQEMEAAFAGALANGEFEAWYQPKFDPATDRVVGAEALVRWRKPEGGMVSPGTFIPLFEKDGLVVRLDEYIFRQVCDLQKRRMDSGRQLLPISVNMSRMALHRADVVAAYRAIVDEYGIPVSCVPIEITESSALSSLQIRDLVQRLKDAGFPLHMDDFGSGYSSLTSLSLLPFDVIKLDKSLTDTLNTPKGQTIVSQMISIVHALGMHVVTEGVEDAAQKEYLRAHGCDAIQGYFYSRPLPEKDFRALVLKNLNEE